MTGLAFWSPWLFWVAVILGGAPVSRMLHPWAGLIFFAAVWMMYVMWAPQMKHTDVDRKWWGAVRYYSTNQDDKVPPAGRYNAGQKFLFWGFFWGAVALLASGVVLWFPEYIPDRKSTRLNSSHQIISYAVFCLKKKKKTIKVELVNI